MRLRTVVLFFALGLCSCTTQRGTVRARRHLPEIRPPVGDRSSEVVAGTRSADLSQELPEAESVRRQAGNLADVSSSAVIPASAEASAADTPRDSNIVCDSACWELTIEEAFEAALRNHPLLRARQHEISTARAQLITAGLLPNPSLVMDTLTPVEGGPTDLTTRIVFTLPTGGKIGQREAVAQTAIVRATFRLSQESQQVLIEVARAALDVLYLQQRLTLQDSFVELADAVAKVQRTRAEQGDISEQELLVAELDAARVEAGRLEVATRLEESRAMLARAAGLTQPSAVRIVGDLPSHPLPSVPLDALLACARQVLPELAESQVAIAQSQRDLSLARAEAIPDVELGPRYRESFGDPDDRIGARFSMNLPIFDRNQGDIAQSRAQIYRAHALLDAAENTTLSNLAAIHAQLTVLQSRLEFFDNRILPLAGRLETTIRRAFESGDINAYEMSLQLQALNQVREDHLELRFLYGQLRVRLDLLLGDCVAYLCEPEGRSP